MKRWSLLARTIALSALFLGAASANAGTDGRWSQAASGNQGWDNTANWANGIVADGTDAAAIFNVNLTADQTLTNVFGRTVGHLFFQDSDTATAGGFGFASEGALGVFTLDVSSGRSVVNIGALNTGGGKKVSIPLPLVNNDGILKINSGQLSLRANSTNLAADFVGAAGLTDTRSYVFLTNITLVGGAQFQVDFGNAASFLTNLVLATTPVTLGGNVLVPNPAIPPYLPLALNNTVSGGGILTISGKTASTNAQTFGGITFNRGSHTINVTSGGNPSMIVVDPTTFTRNPGAVVNFNTPGSGTNILFAGGLANNPNGIIGAWAIDGSNWATVSPANAIAPLSAYETNADPSTWTATTNVSLAGNALAALGTRTINTLRLTASSTNSIGNGNTLTLADGGLLATAGISQITDGTLMGPAGGELIVYSAATNIIGSVIADNGSPSSLIKSSGGILMLTGTNPNTYSGGTYVNQGTLQIGDGLAGGNGQSLGTGPVTLVGGSLQVNRTNDLTIANSISGSGLLIKQGTNTLTLSGNNTYNGFNQSAPGVTASGGAQFLGFAGTRLDNGTLAVATDTAIGGVLRLAGAGTIFRSADATTRTLPNPVDIAVNGTFLGTPTSGDLVFTGPVDTGGGAKTIIVSNNVTRFDGPVRGTGAIGVTNAGPGTLILTVTTNPIVRPWVLAKGNLQISDPGCLGAITAYNAASLQFNGGALKTTANMSFNDGFRGITMLGNGGTFNVDAGTTLGIGTGFSVNAVVGTGGLTKTGTGTLELGSASSYSGATVVNNGILRLVAGGSINASPSITVGPGATFDVSTYGSPFTLAANQTLGGSGTVLGSVTGSGTSVISPGTTSPGTLTLNNSLDLMTGDSLTFDLTNNVTIGGGVNDLVVVNGNLNLNNNTVNIRPIAPGGALATGTYRLINYTGTKTGSLVVPPGSRFTMTLDESTPGQINLVVTGNPASLKWNGIDFGAWDVASSANWLNGGSADLFYDFDTVLFDDSAPGANVVITPTIVQPLAMSVNASKDYSIGGSGALAVMNGLNKGGSGKLTLGNFGAVTVGGPVTITNGTLAIASGSFTSGPIQNDGSLRFQNTLADFAVTNLSGTGSLYAEGAYRDLVLAGDNTYSGATVVSPNARLALYPTQGSTLNSLGASPSVSVDNLGALYVTVPGVFSQALTLNGPGFGYDNLGALRAGSISLTWNGPITLAGDTTVGNDGGTLTLANTVSGAFGLTKSGAGTLVLLSNATYGPTTITLGTLQVGNGGTGGTLGTGPVTNYTVLTVNRSDSLTIPNAIAGTGGLEKTGAGTLTLSGNSTFDGTTSGFGTGAAGNIGSRLTTGTLAIGSDTALGTSLFRLNTAGVTVRAADATTRTIPNVIDIANDFIIGSADTGDLIFSGAIWSGGAAKTLTVSNKVTTFTGIVNGGPSANNITKAGPGTLVLAAINTYQRPTVVNAGRLLVTGQITASSNQVTVAGGTLGGSGLILSPVSVSAPGTLAPGVDGIGTLTISNNLTLAGTNSMEINKTTLSADQVVGLSNVTYGGTLVISNIAGTLAVNDSFKLFDSMAYAGAFASIQPAIPGPGLAWDTNSLAVDGTLKIVVGAPAIPTTPTNIVWGVVAGGLELQWPTNYIGWKLLEQTNNLSSGVSSIPNDWRVYPDSTTTNRVIIPLDPAKPTEFYRLSY